MTDHMRRWWRNPLQWLHHKLLHCGYDFTVGGVRFCPRCGPRR